MKTKSITYLALNWPKICFFLIWTSNSKLTGLKSEDSQLLQHQHWPWLNITLCLNKVFTLNCNVAHYGDFFAFCPHMECRSLKCDRMNRFMYDTHPQTHTHTQQKNLIKATDSNWPGCLGHRACPVLVLVVWGGWRVGVTGSLEVVWPNEVFHTPHTEYCWLHLP